MWRLKWFGATMDDKLAVAVVADPVENTAKEIAQRWLAEFLKGLAGRL